MIALERPPMSRSSLSQSVGLGISYLRVLTGKIWQLEAKLKGIQCDGWIQFEGRPILSKFPGSKIIFRKGVRLGSAVRSNPLGCFQPTVVRTLAPNAELILDENVGISGTVICAGVGVRVGSGTIVGSGAMILDNDFHTFDEERGWLNEYQLNARPIVIGRNVFVGARAIILKSVNIGDRAVIGAGAVVTRDVPAGQVVAGNPAEVISRKQ